MSTAATRPFAAAVSGIPSAHDVAKRIGGAGRSEHLIAASGIVPGDRVVVFGYEILDDLTALARHGVASAAGVHAGYAYRPHEPVDVVWFSSVNDIEAEVSRLLGGIGAPRLVAIELVEPVEFGQLRRLLRCLRAKGLRETNYYKAAGLFVVTARQAWPQRRTRA